VAVVAVAVVAPVVQLASSPADRSLLAAVLKYLSPMDTGWWHLDQFPEHRC
jgi:hypothetical protein